MNPNTPPPLAPSAPFIGLQPDHYAAKLQRGKVRDVYLRGDERLIVATDRISAFDRVVGAVAGRGQVLNILAAWWLKQVEAVCSTHLISIESVHSMRVHNTQPLPVEIIVRGFITGSTKTSLWTLYEQGKRDAYGVKLPEGLRKNDQLPQALITPTSKAEAGGHDAPMTAQAIVENRVLTQQQWDEVESIALDLFALGQKISELSGLVLVDTKYEFGLINDRIVLIDEVHTPDSSRFWSLESYQHNPHQPQSMDKEQLRLWLVSQNYCGEGAPPALSAEIQSQIIQRYSDVYTQLVGTAVPFLDAGEAYAEVQSNVEDFFA